MNQAGALAGGQHAVVGVAAVTAELGGGVSDVQRLQDPPLDALLVLIDDNYIFLWGGLNPWFNVTQPWVQGFAGDFYMGVWNKNAVYARLWSAAWSPNTVGASAARIICSMKVMNGVHSPAAELARIAP